MGGWDWDWDWDWQEILSLLFLCSWSIPRDRLSLSLTWQRLFY